MPTITTIPITVGIRPNMVPVEVSQVLVSSAAIICWVMEMAIAPSNPAIRALIIMLVKTTNLLIVFTLLYDELPGLASTS